MATRFNLRDFQVLCLRVWDLKYATCLSKTIGKLERSCS